MGLDVSRFLPRPKLRADHRCPCLEQHPTVYGLGVCRLCLDAWWRVAPDLPIEERLGDGPIPHRVLTPKAPRPYPWGFRSYHGNVTGAPGRVTPPSNPPPPPGDCNHDADPFRMIPDYRARCARCGTTKSERMEEAVLDAAGLRSRWF